MKDKKPQKDNDALINDVFFSLIIQGIIEKPLKEMERCIRKINEKTRYEKYWTKKLFNENEKLGKQIAEFEKLKSDMDSEPNSGYIGMSQKTADEMILVLDHYRENMKDIYDVTKNKE